MVRKAEEGGMFTSERQGSKEDLDWLYDLYCRTLRPSIELAWGWDDLFQRQQFQQYLLPEHFKILTLAEQKIGAWLVFDQGDHYWLELILVEPRYQRQGLGSRLIRDLLARARRNRKSVRLSVNKTNPVRPFYERLGFKRCEEDKHLITLARD